jgi:nucleoside-diphosphate kinase
VDKIIKGFNQKGFLIMTMKRLWASDQHLKQQHYNDLKNNPFFPRLRI